MKKHLLSALAISVTLLTPSGGSSGLLMAQALEEVIVTAQRRSESTQDIPVAITGFTGNAIEKFGVESTNDVGAQVPNMQVSGPYGEVQPIFSIRGVSMSDYNSNQASPIGVYVDEAYQPAVYSHGANFFDLERLEVLRGPQGTLYGKNTTGGAINMITRTPQIDTELNGRIRAGVGSFDATVGEAAVEGTLIPGTLSARVALMFKKDDGYQENPLGGANGAQTDTRGGRLALNWAVNDNTTAILKVTRTENDANTAQVRNEPGVDIRNTSSTANSNGFIDYTGYSRPHQDLDFHEIESNKMGPLITSTDTAVLTVTADFRNFSLVSVSSYGDAQYFQDANTDGSPLRLLEIDWSSDTIYYSQDIRFVSEWESPFQLIAGLYYGYEDLGLQNIYCIFEDLPDTRVGEENPDAIGLAPFLVGFGCVDQRLRTEKDSRAVYGQLRFEPTDRLGFDLGLRYTEDRNDMPYYNTSRLDYDGTPIGTWVPGNSTGRDEAFTPLIVSPNQIAYCLANPSACGAAPGYTHGDYTLASQDPLEALEKEWTGKLGVDYALTPDILLYASYSRGYRSGSYNGGVYYLERDLDDAYARPEFIDAYEMGIKADLLDGRARFNAAAFYYDYTDQQFVNVVGISVFLENAGASEIQGVEAEFQYQVNERLFLNAGVGLLDTRYKELMLADTTTLANPEDQVDLAGNDLISAPDVNFNLSVDWDVLVTDYGYLSLNVNGSYQSKQWFSAYNDKAEYEATKQDAYHLLNARLSWFSADDRYSLAAFVKNIEDVEYDYYAIDLQASFGYTYFLSGPPKSWGVEASYRF
ncbi:TonB-dependent receptor [Litorivivens sp.]|uniref:TonB-dependent receptor n=1 Tax=Litorivivens sp. TaxID=2020868 RepID=UPI00356358D3